MKKWIWSAFFLIFAVGAAAFLAVRFMKNRPLPVRTYEKMHSLDVMAVCASQIVRGEKSGVSALAMFAADARIGIDLESAEYEWNHPENTVIVTLDKPYVHDERIDESDPAKNRWYELKTSFFAFFPESAKNQLVMEMKRTAEKNIREICETADMRSDAMRQAEICIRAFYACRGYTAVVRWKEKL